jgi:hypothetical protein
MPPRIEPTEDQKPLLLQIANVAQHKRTFEEAYLRLVKHAINEGYPSSLIARYAEVKYQSVDSMKNAKTQIIWPTIEPVTGRRYLVEDLTLSKPVTRQWTESGWDSDHLLGEIYTEMVHVSPTRTESPDPLVQPSDTAVVSAHFGREIEEEATFAFATLAMNICRAQGEDWNVPERREHYLGIVLRMMDPDRHSNAKS